MRFGLFIDSSSRGDGPGYLVGHGAMSRNFHPMYKYVQIFIRRSHVSSQGTADLLLQDGIGHPRERSARGLPWTLLPCCPSGWLAAIFGPVFFFHSRVEQSDETRVKALFPPFRF